MSDYHNPVMLEEVLNLLQIKPNSYYIDCNLGGGGHTQAILQKGGKVIGIDLDPEAIQEVAENNQIEVQERNGKLFAQSDNLILIQTNFVDLESVITSLLPNQITSSIQGILFDLGVSTHQLESPHRGFSFNQNSPLDMRMDPSLGVSAKDLVNALPEKELSKLFQEYGEEHFAFQIARRIVEARKTKPITSSDELAKLISSQRHSSTRDRSHPATRVFQALRIAVNDELNSLKASLPQAFNLLPKNGRLVVISFHSLEDRIVKQFFLEKVSSNQGKSLSKKPITPSEKEIEENPRSRSGKLRGIEKLNST